MPPLDPHTLWSAALGELQVRVARPIFETFFSGTAPLELHGDCLVVSAANPFTAEYLEKRMSALIHKTVEGLAHRSLEVRFRVAGAPALSQTPSNGAPGLAGAAGAPPGPAAHPSRAGTGPDLHPAYTFPAFVVGPSNELAHAAARAVAEAPGQRYNPVFIHSPVGLGKTHLLQAIAHRLRAQGHSAIYNTSEQFTNAFIRSIREGTTSAFRQEYRSVDALLIDDVQFLGGKEQTQEGFFHLFNALSQAKRQVVLTSDQPPQELSRLGERLRSRFGAGLTADIQPPPLETRLAILHAKAANMAVKPPTPVLELIARSSNSNIRELEGRLTRVVALAELCGKPLTPDLVSQGLGPLPAPSHPAGPSPEDVLNAVASHYGLSPGAVTGPRKDREASLARSVTMSLLHAELHHPRSEVARLLGGRHPSAVYHACAHLTKRLVTDPALRTSLETVRSHLRLPSP